MTKRIRYAAYPLLALFLILCGILLDHKCSSQQKQTIQGSGVAIGGNVNGNVTINIQATNEEYQRLVKEYTKALSEQKVRDDRIAALATRVSDLERERDARNRTAELSQRVSNLESKVDAHKDELTPDQLLAFNKAKEAAKTARNTRGLSNFRQIIMAVLMTAVERRGVYPSGLDDLLLNANLPLSVFFSSTDPPVPALGDHPTRTELKQWLETYSSYVLLPPPTTKGAAQRIIIYEKFAPYRKSILVGYNDGHALLSEAAFAAELIEQQTHLPPVQVTRYSRAIADPGLR